MKALLVMIVLVGMALAAFFYLGGLEAFDATAQGKKIRAAIVPGMSYTQVFDIAKEPREYEEIHVDARSAEGRGLQFLKPGGKTRFVRESFERRIRENDMPRGFQVTYEYSSQEAFTVTFDGTGTVVSVLDAVTMADMLQMRD